VVSAFAAGSQGKPVRDFYVWSETSDKYKSARIIFKDTEISNWTWDPVAKAYYWHRFYSHQPDLNFDFDEVRKEMFKALDFWFDMGVDGMRLDAVPYLYEREGTSCENLAETHQFLKQLRKHVDDKYGDRMLLAEANQWPEDAAAYFGEGKGDECHMAFISRSCLGCSCRCAWKTARLLLTYYNRRRRSRNGAMGPLSAQSR